MGETITKDEIKKPHRFKVSQMLELYRTWWIRIEQEAAKTGTTPGGLVMSMASAYFNEIDRGHLARIRAATMSQIAGLRPRRALVSGWLCSSCKHFYQGDHDTSVRLANYCCGPWTCRTCSAPIEKNSSSCRQCVLAQEWDKWQKVERRDPGDAMIYATGNSEWYRDLESFLDHCASEDIDPSSMMPMIGEFQQAGPPDIAESIIDEMYEDWDGNEDWLDDLQKQVNAAFAANNPGSWHEGKFAPIMPEELAVSNG